MGAASRRIALWAQAHPASVQHDGRLHTFEAAAGTGSYAVRSLFKAWLYKPVMAALAVNAPTGSATTPTSCSSNRTGADQWGGASCTYSLSLEQAALLASIVTNLDLCDT